MKKNDEPDRKANSLKWRLSGKLTYEQVQDMLDREVITPDEAKQLLFNVEDKDAKIKTLEDQVEFLKGVVEQLTRNVPVQTVIKYVHEYEWPKRPFYPPQPIWMSTAGSTSGNITTAEYKGDYGTTKLVSSVNSMLDAGSVSHTTFSSTAGSGTHTFTVNGQKPRTVELKSPHDNIS